MDSLKEKMFNFTPMNTRKKLKGAEAFGVKVRRDKSLDKYSGTVLFPEKLAKANEIIARLVWKDK